MTNKEVNMRWMVGVLATALAGLPALAAAATPLGWAFTYQGRLEDGGGPANGTYDFFFTLHDDPIASSPLGTDTADDVPVTSGLFTVEIDFGAAFHHTTAVWLEIAVRPGGSSGGYTRLAARQAVRPTPQALAAVGAGTAASFASNPANCSNGVAMGVAQDGAAEGCVSLTSLNTPSTIVLRNAFGNFTAGTMTGDLAGNAATASALQNNPANCSNGLAAGVSSTGAAEGCVVASTANTPASVVLRDNSGNFGAGTIFADNYNYTNVQTRFALVPDAAFHPRETASSSYRSGTSPGSYRYFNPGSVENEMLATVHLPYDAAVQNLSCRVYDNSSSHMVQVYLLGQNFPAGNAFIISPITPTSLAGADPALQTLVSTPAVPYLVSGTAAVYVNAVLDPGCGANCGISICRIEYTMSRPD
jgi:hypothetical protein